MTAFKDLYDNITDRKAKPTDYDPYTGGNGRIDRAVDLIKKWALNTSTPLTLLDVGGATGNLGYALRDQFATRYTLDIAESCHGPATAKGNTFLLSNVDDSGIPLSNESVDLIVALDFIEHILDPEMFARECHRVLKKGGIVLINTPNIQYWRHLHSLVCEGVFPHTSGDREVYHGGHVAFFNSNDMERIFADFGSHTVHTNGLTPDPPPPIWTTLLQNRAKAFELSFADLIFSCVKQ